MKLEITAGDTAPIELTLEDNGKPVNVTDEDVRFVMAPVPESGVSTPVIEGPATITDAVGGVVRFEWTTLPTPNIYDAQFVVTDAAGREATYPTDPIRIVVLRRVGMAVVGDPIGGTVFHVIGSTRLTVGTTASLIAENTTPPSELAAGNDDYAAISIAVKNITATGPILLGGSGVTVAGGYPWDPADGPLSMTLEPGEQLFGIASTNQDVAVLEQGR